MSISRAGSSLITTESLPTVQHSRFVFDDLDGSSSQRQQNQTLMGSQFAQWVALKAYSNQQEQQQQLLTGTNAQKGLRNGRNSAPHSPSRRKVDAFKPVFFTDPKYNPALNNTHICYEYEAHYKDAERDWGRAGKKFSDEPRIGKPPSSDQGPFKREELPQYWEKEQPIFGAARKIRPFARAQQYTRPVDRCTLPYRPSQDDATSHLGPGLYQVPDPWHAKTGHGNIYGTHPLVSNAKGRDELDDELPIKESVFHQQLTGSIEARCKSPKAALRKSVSAETIARNRAFPVDADVSASISGVTGRRPNTSADQLMHPSRFSVATPIGASSFADSTTDWGFHRGSSIGSQSQSQRNFPDAHMSVAVAVNSRKKGFSFSKSTFSTSSIDIVTGTTNADVLYKRIETKTGEPLIYAISKAVGLKDMPRGAVEKPSWATEALKVDNTLAVMSGIVSPMGTPARSGFCLDPEYADASPITFGVQPSIDDSRVTTSVLPGPLSSPVSKQIPTYRPPSVIKNRKVDAKPKTAPHPHFPAVLNSKFSVRQADNLALALTSPSSAPLPLRDAIGAKTVSSSAAAGLEPSLVESISTQFGGPSDSDLIPAAP